MIKVIANSDRQLIILSKLKVKKFKLK